VAGELECCDFRGVPVILWVMFFLIIVILFPAVWLCCRRRTRCGGLLLPGTELAFEQDVKYDRNGSGENTSFRVPSLVWSNKCAASPSRRDRISDGSNVLVTLSSKASERRAAIASCPSDIGAHHIKAEEHGSTTGISS